jgi:hypothetical protein
MSETTAALVMPPAERILSLPPEQAACIVLAMVGGWGYWVERSGAWWLHGNGEGGRRGCFFRLGIGDTGNKKPWAEYGLPNPFTDPAAAWELETREELDVLAPAKPGLPWSMRAHHPLGQPFRVHHRDRKRAAILAVLHKYATDPRYSALIPPLLKMMEAER